MLAGTASSSYSLLPLNPPPHRHTTTSTAAHSLYSLHTVPPSLPSTHLLTRRGHAEPHGTFRFSPTRTALPPPRCSSTPSSSSPHHATPTASAALLPSSSACVRPSEPVTSRQPALSPTSLPLPAALSPLTAALAALSLSLSLPQASMAAAADAAQSAAAVLAAAAGSTVDASASVVDACTEELGGTDLNTVIIIACVLEFIALTGAGVGGYVARVRKAELEKINAQLRQINISLRRQARLESYAPSLSYAPPAGAAKPLTPTATAATSSAVVTPVAADGGGASAREGEGLAATVVIASAGSAPAAPPSPSSLLSPEKRAVISLLKDGKRWLREQQPEEAFASFQAALKAAREMGDGLEEKKAARGLGASCQRQGKYREAIGFHKLVLETSAARGTNSGITEAYGAIADCYTELGDLEAAAQYYDKYISLLENSETD